MTRNQLFTLASLPLLCGSFALAQAVTTAPAPPTPSASDPAAKAHARTARDVQTRIVRDNVQYSVATGDGGPRPDLRIAPPGMWWKSSDLAQKISLTADQQKRMDDIFQQSRIQLIDLKANVEKQEVMLEPMLSANPPDTNKVLAQIDKVASARAELEKANAKMLLGIRGVLSADQWTKLQAEHLENRRVMMFRTPGSPAMTIPGPPHFKGPDGPNFMFKGPDGPRDHGPGGPMSQLTPPSFLQDFAPGSGLSIGGVVIGGTTLDGPQLEIQPLIIDDDEIDI